MIPSRVEALKPIGKYDVIVEEEKKEIPDVELWKVQKGIPTEIRVLTDFFVLKHPIPEGLDPVEVANNFLQIVDIQKTNMLRKVVPVIGEAQPPHVKTKNRIKEDEEPVEIIGRVAVYKRIITGLYRKYHSKTFTSENITEYLVEMYGDVLTRGTAKSKQYAYAKFMRKEGFIDYAPTVAANSSRAINTYKFINVPYDAKPPAQVNDYDPDYARKQSLVELNTMRGNYV